MQKLIRQVGWFVAVGFAASVTHWLVVVGAVSASGMRPLLANIVGWLVAFCVSFSGHFLLTFRQQRAPLVQAARRFFAVSALGFGVNELAYAWLLHATTLPYDALLALILIGIAGMTFILGRAWAFRHKS
ncbi:GtrA family protein [Candidimonas sp. SYP-B2681]|uniref:GtrA family protein n=1 Tax=Candidimonas sp. SYP-B2681 TaxID=2497686 RepID=UPI000F887814|nr:GtrA family protein [Candidimonas sp. SYP-B2681]RTZ40681.1 GtrA family protein [Candidimonas sp. SYP-B2681]